MKKITLAIILALIALGTRAQESAMRFNLLLDELRYVRDSLDAPITDLSVTQDFRWLITYGKNSYSYLGIPKKLTDRLAGISRSNETILSADLLADSSWIIATSKDKIYFSDLPSPLFAAFENLDNQDARVNFLRVWNDKFIIFYNRYKFLAQGISKKAYRSLNKLIRRGELIKDMEVYGDSFIILFGHKGILGYHVPIKLEQTLYSIQQRAKTIELIRRLPNGHWIVIYNRNMFRVI